MEPDSSRILLPVRGFVPRAHYNSLELSQSCANTNTSAPVNVKTNLAGIGRELGRGWG